MSSINNNIDAILASQPTVALRYQLLETPRVGSNDDHDMEIVSKMTSQDIQMQARSDSPEYICKSLENIRMDAQEEPFLCRDW